MVKIIFSDFDETLMHYYRKSNNFTEYQLSVLKRLKEKGVLFCVVTGRCFSFFDEFPDLLKFVDYLLVSNGAAIYDVQAGKFIYHQFMNENSLRRIVDVAVDNHYSFFINSLEKRFKYVDELDKGNFDLIHEYGNRTEQVVLSCSKSQLEQCVSYLTNISDVVVNNVTCWEDKSSMDINDAHVTKGISVMWLCKYLSIDMEQVIAFGDGLNDRTLFEVVGKSISVGNAHDMIKKNAHEVTFSCEENGVFRYIEENILK